MKHLFYCFASSSSGNCGLLVAGETRILIDLGLSCMKLRKTLAELELKITDLDAIVLTHEHVDHIKGLKTLTKKYDVPIYATFGTADSICRTIPEAKERMHPFYGDDSFSIGAVEIASFLTPHDAAESVGYIFREGDWSFGYATDLGFVPSTVQRRLTGCPTVLLESNHDLYMLETGPYPYPLKQRIRGARGHLSNEDSAYLGCALAKSGTRRLLLAHLSETNNLPRLAKACHDEALQAEELLCEVHVMPSAGRLEPWELD